jgi:hypothetical protein
MKKEPWKISDEIMACKNVSGGQRYKLHHQTEINRLVICQQLSVLKAER